MGTEDGELKVGPEGRARSPRRWRRWIVRVPLLLVLFSICQVVTLRFIDPPFSAVMAQRQLQAWRQGDSTFRIQYQWVGLDEMARSVPISLVAAEDQRFPEHAGFDLKAIEKARDHNAQGRRLRGASTITQQVAKNVFLWQGRSWLRKGLEAWYTVLIELFWPKQRILEMYANVAEFGDGIYGVQAAARQFWGKDAARLSPAESARLAAVLPSPRRYSATQPGPYVQRRAAWIQRQARQLGGAAYVEQLD